MTPRQPTTSRTTPRPRPWVQYDVQRLLDVRLCELRLSLKGTWIQPLIDRLHEELDQRGIVHRPHAWLSSEWFAPDGIPGIAIPFYLAHPKLMKLEKHMIYEVEGGTQNTCMKILRHEAGHAIDSAYRLHFKRRWREVFGRYSQPYPEYYRAKPDSRSFVLHLRAWYAQAHPAEDFAETFAVWLTPRSRWKQTYHNWPAMQKLEYVDALMSDIAGKPPLVRRRDVIEPISQDRRTLREYYHEKRMRYLNEWPDFLDRDLRRLFTDPHAGARRPTAAQFLRKQRPHIRETVARWTDMHPYTIDQVIQDMIDRCKELRLRMQHSERQTLQEATLMITVQTMNFLHKGQRWIAL